MNKLENIEHYERKAVTAPLKDFCYLSHDNDFIEITEWHNGEGYDISLTRNNKELCLSLTSGEIEAISVLSKLL